jgi:L-erythro-3,5-diaminohexanoate dehydrogenase
MDIDARFSGNSSRTTERTTVTTSTLQRSLGMHRVLEPAGVLPQAALRLDADPRLGPDEVRIAVQRLNLDAASYRQLAEQHDGDGDRVRAEVLGIVERSGKMHNPVTGSGGMLIGVVDEVGPESPLGLRPGQAVGDAQRGEGERDEGGHPLAGPQAER